MMTISPAIDAIVNHYYHTIVDPYWPPQRALVERSYTDIEIPFQNTDTAHFRMCAEWSVDDLIGYLGTWSATERYRQATHSDPLPDLKTELDPVWPSNQRTLVVWPVRVLLGRQTS